MPLGAVCAAVVVLAGCEWWSDLLGGGGGLQLDVVECPHYWSRVLQGLADTIAPLAGSQVDVPEYNDCQRLVAAHGNGYGPLGVVFASQRITQLLADQAAASAAAGGLRAVTAATILAVDSRFRPLGIRRGSNCLYLWKDAGGNWDARMVRVPRGGSACGTPLDPASNKGFDLDVREMPTAAGAPPPPAVARWERDTEGGQALGVLCDVKWCVIGRPGFEPSANPAFPADAGLDSWLAGLPNEASSPVTGAQLEAMALSRGWMDEQRLAPAAGGSASAASPLWAAVIPHPSLDTMTDADFASWRVASFVWIPDQGADAAVILGQYQTKFNYAFGWNAISLCGGAACFPTPIAPTPPTCAALPSDEQRWYGEIRPRSGGTPKYFCVKRVPHLSVGHVVGAARWRWIKNDETVWMRCVQGCCEVELSGP